ncbi:outer membrane beta-barrel protein [Proteus hauseri]|uniref:outer membrane beta-barrel protein n=1 Tax=Proteus hauseri TaxID=183417 RepID=UPI0032DBB42C
MFIKRIPTLLLPSYLLLTSPVYADDIQKLLSVGYSHIIIKETPSLNGISLKYQMKTDSNKKTALQIAGTVAQKSFTTAYSKNRYRYASLSMGPAYRFSNTLELYATVGISALAYQAKNNPNENDSAKSLSWGTGITVTAIKNVAITIGYEGGYFKINDISTPTYGILANIGYWF